ncbi:hypothetical protein [Labrys wisconsinensis]|uniref:Twin-arginine translocation pathway signal protein n=1 Tax=Labrys wisconsinensis TaxID=425677 RepID=A0ABU0JF67_9HYPH|nr:hypothetical protein [Labrys wisconsinensis]MDQ0472932.1 hypothetical protein [Labrys wisconsinensis]
MSLDMPTRRAALAVVGASVLAAALAGCTTPAPGLTEQAKAMPISGVHVSGTANRTLEVLAPLVAQELVSELGSRYAPGARGGATLVVELTGVLIETGGNGGSRHYRFSVDAVDQLEGRVSLLGPRGEALTDFPFLASTGAMFRSSLDFYPDPRRLQGLAHAYAYWIARKIG